MKLVPVDFSGGVNLLRDRRYIADNELTWAKNFVPTKSGLAGKRLPRGLMLADGGLPLAFGGPHPIGLYIADVPGADFLVMNRTVVGTQSAYLQAFSYVSSGALASTIYSAIPAKRPQAVNFDHKVYVVTGPETYGGGVIQVSGATAVSGVILQATPLGAVEMESLTFPSIQTIPVAPRMLAAYRRRMVYADFGPGMEDWLIFSDFQQPTVISADVLAANGRNFRLGGTPGRITAIREAMLTSTGSPTETVLLAFKERSMYIIQGEPGQSTDTTPGSGPNTILGDLVVQRVNTDAGCSSPETIVQTPYGLLWAGPDDVWMLREGQTPQRVGTKIRPALEHTPADKRYLWHAAYFNGFYRLSIFSEGQGPSDDSPCGEQWWLDLRDGLDGPPRWWGPMVYKSVPGTAAATPWEASSEYSVGAVRSNEGNTYVVVAETGASGTTGPLGYGTGIVDGNVTWDWVAAVPSLTGVRMQALDTRDGRQAQLLSLEGNNYGQSYLYSYDVGGTSGRDGPAENGGFTGSLLPASLDDSEIEVELRTAESDLGDPGTDKVYAGVELSVASSEAVYMRAETSFDGGARVITNDETMAQTGFVEDVATLDSDLLTREFTAATIRPSALTRPRGITIQQTIKDVPGYIIDETCDQVLLAIQATAVGTTTELFQFSITQGFYADISALVTEICAGVATVTIRTAQGIFWESFMNSNQLPTRSSATVNLQLIPNGGYTIDAWGLAWLTEGTATLNPVQAKLGALLGFDVSGLVSSSATDTLTAVTPVYNKRSAHYELNNIIHDIIPMYRRPL